VGALLRVSAANLLDEDGILVYSCINLGVIICERLFYGKAEVAVGLLLLGPLALGR
jgi:hypothetical protein